MLLPPPKCWDYRNTPLYLVLSISQALLLSRRQNDGIVYGPISCLLHLHWVLLVAQIPVKLVFGHLKDNYALNVFLTVASILLILKLNNGNGIFKSRIHRTA